MKNEMLLPDTAACIQKFKETFRNVPLQEIASLFQETTLQHYKKGTFIYRENTHISGCYFLYSGTVKIFQTGQTGKDQIIRFGKDAFGAVGTERAKGTKVFSLSGKIVRSGLLEVAFGTVQTWAGVTFEFRRGASSDFPGASILIGGKAYYTHWTPAKAHVSHLQISSPAAIDAEIAEAEHSLASGAVLFIGGHGGAATRDAVEFKIAYLKKMKELLAANETAEAFTDAMKQAWPGLPGEAGLEDLGKALYK